MQRMKLKIKRRLYMSKAKVKKLMIQATFRKEPFMSTKTSKWKKEIPISIGLFLWYEI